MGPCRTFFRSLLQGRATTQLQPAATCHHHTSHLVGFDVHGSGEGREGGAAALASNNLVAQPMADVKRTRGKQFLRFTADKSRVDDICRIANRGHWSRDNEIELGSLCLNLTPQLVLSVLKRLTKENAYHFFFWAGKQGRYKHGTRIYNYMLRAVSSLSDHESKVAELLTDMKKRFCLFDDRTFRFIIEMHGQAGKLEEAVGAFNQMEKSVCRPNTPVCSSLIWAAMINDLETAVLLHKNILNAGYKVAETIFRQLFHRLYDAGEEETALSIFQARRERHLKMDQTVYGKVIAIYLKRDQEDEAVKMLKEAKQRNCPWDFLTYLVTREMCKANKLNAAQKFVYTTAKKGCKLHMSRKLIRELCAVADFKGALNFLDATTDMGLYRGREVHNLIVNEICKCKGVVNDWGDRLVCLLLLLEDKGIKFDLDYHTSKLTLLCDHGYYLEALELIDFLIGKGDRPRPYICDKLIQGLLDIGELPRANQLRCRLNLA